MRTTALVFVALVLLGCSAESAAEAPAADPTPVEVATAEPEPTEEPAAAAVTAEDVAAELRTQLGLAPDDSFQSAEPDGWAFYVADVALPQPNLLRVTMQTDGEDPAIEGSSRAIFSLIGKQFPDLGFVEVLDASGNHVEQTARRDVPLLNM